MSVRKDSGSVQAELLKLKGQVDLLEGLCGEDFSEESVRAAAKDIRKHIDRIAELIDTE
jgi:benzoyl-CoA reductase/2-hydroxyglutaryl-CoA dehydratase subunit BcrC/BadD/HgdB